MTHIVQKGAVVAAPLSGHGWVGCEEGMRQWYEKREWSFLTKRCGDASVCGQVQRHV